MAKVTEILSSLQEALLEREKELDAREEKLREDRERLEADRAIDYGTTKPSDVLHLNIGGVKTAVLRRTLTSVPGSMLATKFSGRWDESLERDENGHFFIDQNYSLFKHIIEYLRNKANETEEYPVKSPDVVWDTDKIDRLQEFYRLVEYYGITNGIYPTRLIASEPENSMEILGDKKVHAKEWTSFILARDGHKRRIKTYEVTLGSAQRVQIGWINTESIDQRFQSDGKPGVGEVQYSYALDLTRSCFLVSGSSDWERSTPIEGLEHPKGTVVRSEDYGKVWYINGERLDRGSAGAKAEMVIRAYPRTSFFPAISLKGEFEISFVKLDSKIE